MTNQELRSKRAIIAEGYKRLAKDFARLSERYGRSSAEIPEKERSAAIYADVADQIGKIAARYPV